MNQKRNLVAKYAYRLNKSAKILSKLDKLRKRKPKHKLRSVL